LIRRDAVISLAQPEIGSIQRSRCDFDQDFASSGLRDGNVFELENIFGRTELMYADRFHGPLLLIREIVKNAAALFNGIGPY
jgi:hypothetical protein